jgi:hypothetical protein
MCIGEDHVTCEKAWGAESGKRVWSVSVCSEGLPLLRCMVRQA